jgi:Predicted transcriptional regulator
MNKELVLHLKQLKKKRKITNEEISALSQTPLSTINKLFSGCTADPKLSTVIAVCKVLDVSVDDIIRGTADSSKQISLTEEESRTLTDMRKLDSHSRNLISTVINCELTKQPSEKPADAHKAYNMKAVKGPPIPLTVTIPLYELPIYSGESAFSVGTSEFTVTVPKKSPQKTPDFALKIEGDSMEPDYAENDIILVKRASSAAKGHLGVFSLNGEIVVKIFAGNKLVSINKNYNDITLRAPAVCVGEVVGKLNDKAG